MHMLLEIKHIKYFLFVSLSFVFSCMNKTTNENIKNDITDANDVNIIEIPDDFYNSKIDLGNLVSSIKYVPLETKPTCFIGQINKVLSDTGSFFIHDKDNNSIIRFNEKGKFLNRIGAIGDGPGEFKEAYDVSLKKGKREVSVLDLRGRKLINYDYDGAHINSLPMKFLFNQLVYIGDTIVCNIYKSYNAAMPSIYGYKVVKINQNFDVLSKALPYQVNNTNSFTTKSPLRKFGNSVFFNDPYRNKIYKITPRNTYVEFEIDFNKNGWNQDLKFENLNDAEINDLFESYSYFNGEFVASTNYLVFNVYRKNRSGTIYYSRNTRIIKYGNSYKNPKSRFQLVCFSEPKWLNYDDSFISSIEPFHLIQYMEYIKEENGSILTKKQQAILDNVKEEDNPILAIYELNDF